MKEELMSELEAIAFKKTEPFCYGCYVICPTGICSKCGSDDLMRHMKGVGVEWGTEWVVKELLTSIDTFNGECEFDEYLEAAYGDEAKVGWLTIGLLRIIKNLCECDYQLAFNDWLSDEERDREIVSFNNGSTYYKVTKIKEYIEENS